MPADAGSTQAPAGGDRRGAASWFVRRAGLARCTTVAVAAGLALAAMAPGHQRVAVALLAVALAGALAGQALGQWAPGVRAALPLMLVSVVLIGSASGLLVGGLRLSSLLSGSLPSRIGETVRAEVVVTGPVSIHSGWQSAIAEVVRLSPVAGAGEAGTGAAGATGTGGAGTGGAVEGGGAGAHEKVLLEVAPGESAVGTALFQGARLSVSGELAAPDGPSASGYDQAKTLLHQGVRVVLQVDAPSQVTVLGRRGGVNGWFDRLREVAKAHLSHGPDARINEVLQGVVMGDTVGIDEGWMDAFRRSGTAHMLSVSGLHVACLAAIMIAIAGFARLSRRTGVLLAAGAALLMVPFVGPSPPIVRSAAMMVVVLGGRLVGRRRDQWQGLAFAAIVVLAMNPFAVFDVGFQLSFSAFAGMLGLVRPFERLFRRLPESVRANLAVSVAATVGTAPVSMVVFGRTSLISPVANLLVVPVLGAVTGLGMGAVLLGFLWNGFSVAFDTAASLPMMWGVMVSVLCARVPVLEARRLGMVAMGVCAAVLALPAALALTGRAAHAPWGLRLPGLAEGAAWLRRHRPRRRGAAAAMAILLVVAAAGAGAGLYPASAAAVRSAQYLAGGNTWPSNVEVRVLDVGQGTAVLVRTPDHRSALFDGGPAGCGLEAQLRALGVKHLDLVVISHPHADHFAGLAEATGSLDVGVFMDRVSLVEPVGGGASGADAGGSASGGKKGGGPVGEWSSGESSGASEAGQYLEMRAAFQKKGTRLALATSGEVFSFYGVTVRLYAPAKPIVLVDGPEPWGEGHSPPTGDELNAGSIVVRLEAGGGSLLLTGDAEADTLVRYGLGPVDVFMVGHHGSRGAVSDPLLGALRPRSAVISVGKDNTFGHPAPGTMIALAAAAVPALRTDRVGWVSLTLDDGAIAVATERTEAR